MAGYQRQLRLRQVAVYDVEVRAADAAGEDADEQLAGLRLGIRQIPPDQRRTGLLEDHRPHDADATGRSGYSPSVRSGVRSMGSARSISLVKIRSPRL